MVMTFEWASKILYLAQKSHIWSWNNIKENIVKFSAYFHSRKRSAGEEFRFLETIRNRVFPFEKQKVFGRAPFSRMKNGLGVNILCALKRINKKTYHPFMNFREHTWEKLKSTKHKKYEGQNPSDSLHQHWVV